MGQFTITPEIDSVSIVLLGHFNPMIFHPGWFLAQDIFSPEEVDRSSVEIIHPEIAKFDISWLSVQVEKSRFMAESKIHPLIRVSDFIISTFGDHLIHTPITRVGINRSVHFQAEQVKIDKLGKTLAPQCVWGDWGREIEGPKLNENESNSKHGGLRLVIMEQRNLSDRYKGHIQAQVQPSFSVNSGVSIDINDHYEIDDSNNVVGCKDVISIIKDNFEKSLVRSEKIINHIMSIAK